MTTLLQLKNRKADLQKEINLLQTAGEIVSEGIFDEYQTVIDQLIAAEKQLLKPVDKCAQCRWLHE